jgi:Zn finger protein HypA/HybF involved in hydrogenase expression
VPPEYSEQEAREAIAASLTVTEALRRLGMCPTGNAPKILRKYIAEWRIPIDHFDPDLARRRALERARITARPLEDLLVRNSTARGSKFKVRLYREGLKQPRCELCGQGETWRGRPMALILDHVNGDSRDNRLENLRIVCPNCNATLDTHCGSNASRLPSERTCARCGSAFRPKYRNHRYCSRDCGQRAARSRAPHPDRRKVERPPYEQLVAEIEALGYSAVGRKYDVSDNAIRKWVRGYEQQAAH